MKNENQTAPVTSVLTWDQALLSFCFVKYITVGKAKRKENLVQTFYETSSTHFWLIDICQISQPKLLPLLVILVCQFFIRGKNVDPLTWKIAFIF